MREQHVPKRVRGRQNFNDINTLTVVGAILKEEKLNLLQMYEKHRRHRSAVQFKF